VPIGNAACVQTQHDVMGGMMLVERLVVDGLGGH
jgi:hypothetical protein